MFYRIFKQPNINYHNKNHVIYFVYYQINHTFLSYQISLKKSYQCINYMYQLGNYLRFVYHHWNHIQNNYHRCNHILIVYHPWNQVQFVYHHINQNQYCYYHKDHIHIEYRHRYAGYVFFCNITTFISRMNHQESILLTISISNYIRLTLSVSIIIIPISYSS